MVETYLLPIGRWSVRGCRWFDGFPPNYHWWGCGAVQNLLLLQMSHDLGVKQIDVPGDRPSRHEVGGRRRWMRLLMVMLDMLMMMMVVSTDVPSNPLWSRQGAAERSMWRHGRRSTGRVIYTASANCTADGILSEIWVGVCLAREEWRRVGIGIDARVSMVR